MSRAPMTPSECDTYIGAFSRIGSKLWGASDHDAVRWAMEHLVGLKAEMQAQKDETVVVARGVVVVAEDGSWVLRGSSSEPDADVIEAARADLGDTAHGAEQFTWFVGYAARPQVATVNATSVVGGHANG